MEPISIDDFKKVEIRVGEVVSAEEIEGSDKLLKLRVNFGDHERQVLSGIKAYVAPQDIVGKRYPFVTNLPPRTMMGFESRAMILAVGGGPSTELGAETPFALFETTGAPGDRVK